MLMYTTKECNYNSIVTVHQHGGYDVPCKPRILITHGTFSLLIPIKLHTAGKRYVNRAFLHENSSLKLYGGVHVASPSKSERSTDVWYYLGGLTRTIHVCPLHEILCITNNSNTSQINANQPIY